MALYNDTLWMYCWDPYRKFSVPQRRSVGMFPVHITLGILVAMLRTFKQFVMQLCASYSPLFLPLDGI